jgi:hypothetical protein
MNSPCERCRITNGKAHSFIKMGTLKNSETNIFYTAPSKCLEPEDSPEAIAYYMAHFEETRPNKWIWIFDCQGMKTKDLIKSGVAKKLAELVQKTYFDTLQSIYIVNPTWQIKTLLTFLTPFLLKETRSRIHLCSNGILDTIHKLESIGLTGSCLASLSQQIMVHHSPSVEKPLLGHLPSFVQLKQNSH